jgi:hypothetical protein
MDKSEKSMTAQPLLAKRNYKSISQCPHSLFCLQKFSTGGTLNNQTDIFIFLAEACSESNFLWHFHWCCSLLNFFCTFNHFYLKISQKSSLLTMQSLLSPEILQFWVLEWMTRQICFLKRGLYFIQLCIHFSLTSKYPYHYSIPIS